MHLAAAHDPALVALSVLVACFASYTALDLGGRIRVSRGWSRLGWLGVASVTMGGGIWSMHFIAMLAFALPVPVSFDRGLTALSLAVAMAVTAVGFYVIGTRPATKLQLGLAGVFMGLGIVAMHYTGMAAMRMAARLTYDPLFVALSVVIAIGAATAALALTLRTSAIGQRILAAVIMGFAISGMHYTGMLAAHFTVHSAVHQGHGPAIFEQTNLALSVAGITFVILLCALVASLVDRQFVTLAERESTALRRSEEQFRKLYRETPLPLYSLDPDGRVEGISDAWLKLLGYTRDEPAGRRLTDFLTEDSKQRYEQAIWPILRAGGEIREAEVQFVSKSGKVIDVLLSARPEAVDGRFVRTLSGLVDITARKRAEEALRLSQRMEAIGQVTGGVAHDFNNLLLVISGATHRLATTTLDPAAQRALDMIATAVKRGQSLTSKLLTVARRQTLEPTVIDLGALLPTFSEMLRRSLRGNIELRTVAADRACRVRVDLTELELAMLNLGVNARDAMPNGGALTLSIKTVSLAGEVEADGLHGNYVLLEISDTGVGISPELISRIFEPFFTTKGPGKGTGLGLSQVYGFARQSGGTATVRSIPGKGTTVALYLPVTHLLIESDVAPRTRHQEVAGRDSGNVLLIEDNEDVAVISAGYLEELGYQVDHVANGPEALRRLQTNQSYSLIFSDILMPGGTSGLELARIVRERHPELPVLLTTGYSASAQEAVRAGFSIIQKPYDLRDLTAAVRDVTPPLRSVARS